MTRSVILGALLVSALGAAAYWGLMADRGRSSPAEGVSDVEQTPSAPPERVASSRPSSAPVVADVPWEAVARDGETLPARPRPAAPVHIPISMDTLRDTPGQIRGADLVDAIVAAKVLPVRYDSERTRDRFRHARVMAPPPMASPDGAPGFLLIQVGAILRRSDEFSAKLDDRALWIGARGVY